MAGRIFLWFRHVAAKLTHRVGRHILPTRGDTRNVATGEHAVVVDDGRSEDTSGTWGHAWRSAVIVQLIDGYGLLKDKDHRVYPFRFDRIVGYHGEYPREIGLRVGRCVEFKVERIIHGDEKVDVVELVKLP